MEKLILSSQSILATIADLKRSVLLSDFPAMNQIVKERREFHDLKREECEKRVQQARCIKV